MEVGFELLLAAHPERVLGTAAAERFGDTFPIHFDYLDTMEGGHLSVQCHPAEAYARETFGLDYTQEEFVATATALFIRGIAAGNSGVRPARKSARKK